MTVKPDRPDSLARMPKPAPDEIYDPVDTPSVMKKTTPAPAESPRRVREAKAPLSALVSLEIIDIVEEISIQRKMTKRSVIEEAIRAHWGSQL